MHRAEFVDVELSILHSRAFLHVKQRTGRLQSLRDKHDYRQRRKNDQHNRKRDREIDCSFEESVQWIFERLFAQSDESKTAIFKMSHRMAQSFLQIAQD